MRIGAEMQLGVPDPDLWIAALRERRYTTAIWPEIVPEDDEALGDAFAAAAGKAGITIGEVGSWCNPIHPDPNHRKRSLDRVARRLAIAERIGARCCVSTAGSRAPNWLEPHPENLSRDTFDLIVATVRQVLDAVRPKRTFYTLETMPWIYPDSPDSYLELIRAVDRPRFAVHFDPVNMITSPDRYFHSTAFLRDCAAKLAPYIRSCHAKDTLLQSGLTWQVREAPPGQGMLDYATYVELMEAIDPDMPMILEHFSDDVLTGAAIHIRGIAESRGIAIRGDRL